MNKENTNILQLEAKDIFAGVEIKKGNYKRYKGSLDYSLDAIKIDELSKKKKEFYEDKGKQYTDSVISVTFKYSVKDENGKTIVKTRALRDELYENGFDIDFATDKKVKKVHFVRFKRSSGSSRVGKCLFIREDLYEDMIAWSYMDICHDFGIPIDLASVEAYIALTTSSIIDTIDDIKAENILIIDEYESVFKNNVMATEIVNIDDVDRLYTEPKEVEIHNNIWDGQALLCSSVFNKDRIKKVNDEEITYNYKDKGMLLLRNRFFKGACFNTEIQQFFEDAGITKISELNGITTATDISQIKMICTNTCIKYTKFGKVQEWLKLLDNTWGIVKYDKPTHHMLGRYVSTHYQLLQTVQFNREETLKFLEPTMDYLNKLMNDTRVMRNHLKMKIDEDIEIGDISSTDDLMMTMMQLNDTFTKTQMYLDFRSDVRESFIKDIKKGHVLIEGNYSVLFGNGLEMLKATIKDKDNKYYFTGKSVLNVGEIHNTNFKYGIELLGCRSPHVTIGNLLIAKNVECNVIDKYFNLSKQIVCVNSIEENLLERLSSADYDSDQVLLSDSKQLISKIKENYDKFLVPTSCVKAEKTNRLNTWKDKSDLDIKTSVNKIGEIINLSQIINTYLWHRVSKGESIDSKEIQDLYADISQLDVMSCIEIDKAKKEFTIDNVVELNALRKKYKITTLYNNKGKKATEEQIELYEEMMALKSDEQDYKYFAKENNVDDYYTKTVKPNFMKFTGSKKNRKKILEANKKVDFKHYNSTMCYLEDVVKKEFKDIKATKISSKDITTFSQIFQTESKILTSKCDKDRVSNILNLVKKYKNEVSAIWSKENSEDATEEEIKELKTKKYKAALEKKNKCIAEISKLKVKAEDIKRIIKDLDIETQEVVKIRNEKKKSDGKKIDETKEYEIFGIGRFLLSVLFKAHNEEFLRIFKEQKEEIETLRLKRKIDDIKDKEIVTLYNIDFVVEKIV